MATRNRVEILITAIDEGTPVFERFASNANGLIGGVLSAAFDMAKGAASGFMKAVDAASDATTDNIMAVGSLASAMGASFDIADKLNNKITQGLAEQAASLPGSTDDYVRVYRTISDDVASMSKELNGGKFSAEKFEKQVVGLTSKFTALKGSASIAETIQGLQAALGGRAAGQLGKLKFYRERNPMLLSSLQKVEQQSGKSLKEAGKGERLQMIIKAVDMTLTDDTVKRMSSTFDAIKQTFLTKLWDPNIGMFGLLRDVDKNLENGVQSAFGAITEALDSVIGENGVLTAFGNLLVALGLDAGDPMVAMRNGMLTFAGWMKDLANWFQMLTGIIQAGGNGKDIVIRELLKIPDKIGAWLAGLVNSATAGLGANGGNIGQMAMLAARVVGAIFSGINTFLANLSPQSWMAIAGGLLVAGSLPILGAIIAAMLGAVGLATAGVPLLLVAGAAAAAIGIVGLIAQNWTAITTSIGTFVNWAGAGIQGFFIQLAAWLLQNLAQVTALVGAVMSGNFVLAGTLFSQFFGGFTNGLTTALGELLMQAIQRIKDFVTGIGNAIANFFSAINSQLSGALGNAAQTAVSAVPGASSVQGVANLAGSAMGAAGGAANAAGSALGAIGGMLGIGGAATGYLPGTGLGGLLGAAMTEARKMPAGSNLMVANSSEAILTSGQQGALAGSMGGGNRGGSFAPQITVHAAPGMDVNALAAAVMAKIESAYKTYEMGFLT